MHSVQPRGGRVDRYWSGGWTTQRATRRERLAVGLYTGMGYRDDDVSIGAPDVVSVRRRQKASASAPAVAPPIERWLDAAVEREDILYFSIYHVGALGGQIFLHDIDETAGASLVGYHLFEAGDRGKGIGTTALRLFQRFVVEETRLVRLIAITSADNAASRRIAEKCRFIHTWAPLEDPTGVLMEWQVPRDR